MRDKAGIKKGGLNVSAPGLRPADPPGQNDTTNQNKNMNPYQKIIIDGKEIQKGHIDTLKKFDQLMTGIDLKGKSVLDVGCNLGMMCRLAKDRGAGWILGIDPRIDYIESARELHPDLNFTVKTGETASGNFDIVIASAMFHYVKDHDRFLNQLARVGEMVVMDVWIGGDADTEWCGPAFYGTHRKGIYAPNIGAWSDIASRRFGKISMLRAAGDTESPDGSKRGLFHLSEPKPDPAKLTLIYGQGGTGKTTLMNTYLDRVHLQLDQVFIKWKCENQNTPEVGMSVRRRADLARRNPEELAEYFSFHREYLAWWFKRNQNRDMVVEGYDMLYADYRDMVNEEAANAGWNEIEEIKLTEVRRK